MTITPRDVTALSVVAIFVLLLIGMSCAFASGTYLPPTDTQSVHHHHRHGDGVKGAVIGGVVTCLLVSAWQERWCWKNAPEPVVIPVGPPAEQKPVDLYIEAK